MGTVVSAGSGRGVVVATGGATEFGRIALGLGERHPETEFQTGLRQFSLLLVKVAGVLTTVVLVVNLLLGRPFLDALLFSLAIAVGISPQLLPAVVSTSLAAGSRRLARRKVLVRRLVCIEDLGDIEVLFTDKTGTLTEGRTDFMRALGAAGSSPDDALVLGLVCTEGVVEGERLVGGNPLDTALWLSPAAPRRAAAGVCAARDPAVRPRPPSGLRARRRSTWPAHAGDQGGAGGCAGPLHGGTGWARRGCWTRSCAPVTGSSPWPPATSPSSGTSTPADEHGLALCGFLVFLDPPKATAARGPRPPRRAGGGGEGHHRRQPNCGRARVRATSACRWVTWSPVPSSRDLDDTQLGERLAATTVFARVDPEQKARIVRAQRRAGLDAAYLGDGVNDALALHAADVGISVDSATDVAKDAADVVLLEKDLRGPRRRGRGGPTHLRQHDQVRPDGNLEQLRQHVQRRGRLALPALPAHAARRRSCSTTCSTTPASSPSPPTTSTRSCCARPTRWDIGLIRRFMLVFGPSAPCSTSPPSR